MGLITDGVIDSAVRRLPEAHFQLDGTSLATTLKHRRDALREAANEFYRHLAAEVDVHGTNRADSIHVLRVRDTLDLTIYPRGVAGGPYFRRRFTRSATKEVRLYLMEGSAGPGTTG
jgi:hypothetical protein